VPPCGADWLDPRARQAFPATCAPPLRRAPPAACARPLRQALPAMRAPRPSRAPPGSRPSPDQSPPQSPGKTEPPGSSAPPRPLPSAASDRVRPPVRTCALGFGREPAIRAFPLPPHPGGPAPPQPPGDRVHPGGDGTCSPPCRRVCNGCSQQQCRPAEHGKARRRRQAACAGLARFLCAVAAAAVVAGSVPS
jgi:hypothetical protein